MSIDFDLADTESFDSREARLFARLPEFLKSAAKAAPALGEWLKGHDLTAIAARGQMAKLPVMRKDDLMALQAASPPFGGMVDISALKGTRVFMSPGPVFEPQGAGIDPWQGARALHAAGFRAGDTVWNGFAYHVTPGGFILDESARALGCTVFPGGGGGAEQQIAAAAALRPRGYTGTPDALKIMLDKAAELGADLSSITVALVSGGALFPALRQDYAARGVSVMQCYATADLGVIAYETKDSDGEVAPGMAVNENLIVEIVTPGTDDPVAPGEVGEVVVTTFNPVYPLVRFGTGDLSKSIGAAGPGGHAARRIAGWMGRADQRTKVKGMFVDPKQMAELARRHGGLGRVRLVVTRDGDRDAMTLKVEPKAAGSANAGEIAALLRDITGLSGAVEIAEPGTLPGDGKVIADERDYSN